MRGLTLFSWGYWGWGKATDQLVDAVDAVEAARGFEPPLFVDIRIHRNVRAAGFRANSFEQRVGRSRYRWMNSLGNVSVQDRSGPGVRIKQPSAVEELLDLAIASARRHQHVLFFCGCEFPKVGGRLACHRLTVADLLLAAARRRGTPIQVVEWPGGEPHVVDVKVTPVEFAKLLRGRKSIMLGQDASGSGHAGVPWGSIAHVCGGRDELRVLTGPAKYATGGWYLPVLSRTVGRDTAAVFAEEAGQLRQQLGLEPRR